MLKQEFTYEDWDGETVTDTFYFNLSASDLERPELDEFNDKIVLVQGLLEARAAANEDPTPEERRLILSCVKELMRISYGVREGKRFKKALDHPDIWAEFVETAAYDPFLKSLFEKGGEGAVKFMLNVFPRDIREEIETSEAVREVLASVSETPAEPTDEIDPDELLKQAPVESEVQEGKIAITETQRKFMQERLSKAQFDDWMSKHYVK